MSTHSGSEAYLCDGIRTPIGRYGGSLAKVRTDDLGAIPVRALMQRNLTIDWEQLDELFYGCANQAGEDNRNVARMCALLAGLPESVAAVTINRLCGSGMDAVGTAARAIKTGEIELAIAGGVESMSRAPFVFAKAEAAFDRTADVHDTTIGWRFINPLIQQQYGVDSMPETAENVAADFAIARADQDAFAWRSQQRTQAAMDANLFAEEITPVEIPQRKGEPAVVDSDEHPRPQTCLDSLARLRTPFRENGSVTAGNASGVNDGACALLLASDTAIKQWQLQPQARILGMATIGVAPRIMGYAPAPASRKVLQLLKMKLQQMDVIELNEAFAAQALAVLRDLNIADDAAQVNPNGGAIALGHPLGMSGARLLLTAMRQLQRTGGHFALCTMCIGVGQGIAVVIERV